ncbi:MAG: efflux RND transporter periplasmic adaptor subunit [Desulfovibrionaceae bacterium]|jgi:membrane fusion protein (multidrug efflux system)|nr:efflux RND transporter periplasmic adaptor subunit [Desulfovibrionaceae bacterium]
MQTIPPAARRARVLSTGLLLALLCLAALAAGCNGSDATANATANSADRSATNGAAEARAYKVSVETVVPRAIRDVLTLPGATEADADVTLSAEREGRVEWIGPREGDRVAKGETIAKVDMAALEAALSKARASYELSKKQAERRADLEDKRVVSREEFDQAVTDLRLAEGNLREAEVDYRQGSVRSPIAGVVNTLHVDPGEFVNVGSPVAEVVNLEVVRVNVDVPELDIRFIRENDPVHVTVDAYAGREWTGRVAYVSMKADEATKTFRVRVAVANKDHAVRPGMLARASFLRRSLEDALTVPLFSILDKGGERIVFVVQDGHAAARTIVPGVIDGDRAQILRGVAAGDAVVVSGQTEIEDGSPVTVQ